MSIINGTKLPHRIEKAILEEEAKAKSRKKQFWINILINVLCVALGALFDNIVAIFNWITNIII